MVTKLLLYKLISIPCIKNVNKRTKLDKKQTVII